MTNYNILQRNYDNMLPEQNQFLQSEYDTITKIGETWESLDNIDTRSLCKSDKREVDSILDTMATWLEDHLYFER